jgi:hypothetical protein
VVHRPVIEGHEVAAGFDPSPQSGQRGRRDGAGAKREDADQNGVEPGEVARRQVGIRDGFDGKAELCEISRGPVGAPSDVTDPGVLRQFDAECENPHHAGRAISTGRM